MVQKATIAHILYSTFFSCGRFLSTTSLRQSTDANTFKMSKRTQEGTLSPKTPLCLKLRITTVIVVDKASKIITAAKYSPGNKMRKEQVFISQINMWTSGTVLQRTFLKFTYIHITSFLWAVKPTNVRLINWPIPTKTSNGVLWDPYQPMGCSWTEEAWTQPPAVRTLSGPTGRWHPCWPSLRTQEVDRKPASLYLWQICRVAWGWRGSTMVFFPEPSRMLHLETSFLHRYPGTRLMEILTGLFGCPIINTNTIHNAFCS